MPSAPPRVVGDLSTSQLRFLLLSKLPPQVGVEAWGADRNTLLEMASENGVQQLSKADIEEVGTVREIRGAGGGAAQRDMERRLQIKSLEDEITFVSGVTRRCWSACIEDADAPTQGNIAVDLSADELSCIGNCTSKVKAFQMRAAEVLMDQDAKKREANMKQMMHQQRAA